MDGTIEVAERGAVGAESSERRSKRSGSMGRGGNGVLKERPPGLSRRCVLPRAAAGAVGLLTAACGLGGRREPETTGARTAAETGPVQWLTYASGPRLEAYERIRDAFPATSGGLTVDLILV